MSAETHCDRCGVVKPWLRFGWTWDCIMRAGYKDIDLCPKCKDEFTDFLHGRSVQTVEDREATHD